MALTKVPPETPTLVMPMFCYFALTACLYTLAIGKVKNLEEMVRTTYLLTMEHQGKIQRTSIDAWRQTVLVDTPRYSSKTD